MINRAYPVNAQGAGMLTADTITDEQIRELSKVVRPLGVADILCRIALGLPLPDKTIHGDALKWGGGALSNTSRTLAGARLLRRDPQRAH